MYSTKCLNLGIRMVGFLYGGSGVFLVGVIELAACGFIWVKQCEADLITSTICVDMYKVQGPVLYA